MRQPATPRPFREQLHIALHEPAGLVCAALVLALLVVVARIAAVW